MTWFGKTGVAFFDRWSVIHLCFWMVACGDMAAKGIKWWLYWPITVGVAYFWEVFEQYIMERKMGWVAHPESLINRWVSDPLMAVIAGVIAWFFMRGQ